MIIKGHKRKSKWHAPTFSIREIDRGTLSLLLVYAREGIAKDPKKGLASDALVAAIEQMDEYVNSHDQVVWLTPRSI